MVARRIGLLFMLGISLILLASCATTRVSSKGALVSVYMPSHQKEALVCSSGGNQGIAYMYVGPDTITGKVTSADKRLIAQYARAALSETRFINPVSVSSDSGEYPDLSIRVMNFIVQTKPQGINIKRHGIFLANFSIRQAGILECSTAEPILVEKTYIEPAYAREKLPSIYRVKAQMVKDAVRRVIMQFTPVKSTILRPVKYGGGLSSSIAKMIDSGNCVGAFEAARAIASSKKCKDSDLLYNVGVALECMAWNSANTLNRQQMYLSKALKYYRRAAMINPDDKDIQKAMSDVYYELNTVFTSEKRQNRTKKMLKQFEAPSGF